MQEIKKKGMKLEKVRTRKKVRNPKKQEIKKSRKSEKLGEKIMQLFGTICLLRTSTSFFRDQLVSFVKNQSIWTTN